MYLYPELDSVVWSAAGAPAVERALGFDPEDGAVAVIDDKGLARRIDLRATEVRFASRAKLAALTSANGADIFGVTEKGDIARLSPGGDWSFEPPSPARFVFPQPNGSVVIAANQGAETHLWLIRPPSEDIIETAILPLVSRGIRTQIGDRLYFTVDSGLIGVTTRTLAPVKGVRLPARVVAITPTPSGDRLYAALRGRNEIAVIDRYSEAVRASVQLPGPASELRMDPLGQHVIARPASEGDSAWLIAVGTDRVAGTLRTAWRPDLPAFAPGGIIATARGDDVVLVRTADLRESRTIPGGAKDFWYFFAWNGFRPRAADLDRPVTFDSPSTAPLPDSLILGGDSVSEPAVRDRFPTQVEPPTAPPARARGYMVSFAAVLSPEKANEVAAGISVNGVRPRVAATQSGSTNIYRVVLGPFPTREEADRVGRESKRQYWVYEEAQ